MEKSSWRNTVWKRMMRSWLGRSMLECKIWFYFFWLFLPLIPYIVWSYEELAKDYEVTYVAGGAAQNAARGAAVSWRSTIFSFRCLAIEQLFLFGLSIFFPLNQWCTLGQSVKTTLLSNSRKPTNVRVWIKYIKSRKAKRQALALSSSQGTFGMSSFIHARVFCSSLKHFQLSCNQFVLCWKIPTVTFINSGSCTLDYRCKSLLCYGILLNPRCGVCSWSW